MARYIVFGDEFLNRVLDGVDLHALIDPDVKLKPAGRNFVAYCPFHSEKTPSFTVSPSKKSYRCYGCGVHGDAIDWMRNKHHLSFHDAVVHLAGVCGLHLPAKQTDEPEDKAQRKRLAGMYQALKEAARIFTHGLNKSPAARAYLENQRDLSSGTIQRFGLGVVAKGMIHLLSNSTSREALLGSGLAAERETGDLYDRFRHRIMFPIHTERGNLIGFAGRSMIEKPDRTPKYINGPETEFFHKGHELYGLHLAKPAIRSGGIAIIVEGYFDVIRLHQAGDERAVAPMGTTLTQQQARRLLVHADTIIFAFDGDAAGRKAAFAAAAVLLDEMKEGKTGRFLFLPEGEDPDTFVRSQGLSAWSQAIEAAMPLSTLLADYVGDGLDRSTPESQVKAAEKAQAILARIQHAEIFRRAMKMKFEEIIGVPLN